MPQKFTFRFKKLTSPEIKDVIKFLEPFGHVEYFDGLSNYTNFFLYDFEKDPEKINLAKTFLLLMGYHFS